MNCPSDGSPSLAPTTSPTRKFGRGRERDIENLQIVTKGEVYHTRYLQDRLENFYHRLSNLPGDVSSGGMNFNLSPDPRKGESTKPSIKITRSKGIVREGSLREGNYLGGASHKATASKVTMAREHGLELRSKKFS